MLYKSIFFLTAGVFSTTLLTSWIQKKRGKAVKPVLNFALNFMGWYTFDYYYSKHLSEEIYQRLKLGEYVESNQYHEFLLGRCDEILSKIGGYQEVLQNE